MPFFGRLALLHIAEGLDEDSREEELADHMAYIIRRRSQCPIDERKNERKKERESKVDRMQVRE